MGYHIVNFVVALSAIEIYNQSAQIFGSQFHIGIIVGCLSIAAFRGVAFMIKKWVNNE